MFADYIIYLLASVHSLVILRREVISFCSNNKNPQTNKPYPASRMIPGVVPTATSPAQMTREGLVTKYCRRNSGEMESSPWFSTWFREDILADQR